MKCVINCRKARYFAMDIEWFTLGDRGVYADCRHFRLGYLNIFVILNAGKTNKIEFAIVKKNN